MKLDGRLDQDWLGDSLEERGVVGQVLSIREESTATGGCLPETGFYSFGFDWVRVV